MTPSRLSITAAGQRFRVQLEQAEAGWLAYPEGINGVVLSQGDTAAEALADLQSALRFHRDTFGRSDMTTPASEP
jgi:predicted RNase H-like HicB family nuclease